jgi:glycerol-3-phosphate dehydrogenase
MHSYGAEEGILAELPGADHWIAPGLSEAMVRFAARYEYALTVEDVLARRCRLLFLDAKAAAQAAPQVAQILDQELGGRQNVAQFLQLAEHFSSVP